MSLTVTVPAKHKELTTLLSIKNELNLTASTYDGLLVAFIQYASDYIEKFTDRTFARETVVETLPSFGRLKLVLTRTPIIKVNQVRLNGSTVSSTTYELDDKDSGILFNKRGWTRTTIVNQNIEPILLDDGARDWEVTYVGGYITPGSTEGQRTLPYDVERACIDIVKSAFNRRDEDAMIRTQKLGDASETLFDTGGIPPSTIKTLDAWKRIDL